MFAEIMQNVAVVALALLESVQAFQAPAAMKASRSLSSVQMFSEGDIGVLPPLGVYDPLGWACARQRQKRCAPPLTFCTPPVCAA